MSLENLMKSLGIPAAAVGIGVVALAPLLLRRARSDGRPFAKLVLHKYLDLVDAVEELSAEKREQLKDLLAEVKAERRAEEAAALAAIADRSPEA